MKSLMEFLFGIVLTIIGAALFLMNIKVSSFRFFYHYHGTNVTALLLIVLCILFVAFVVFSNFFLGILLGLVFLLFIISIILSMNFYVRHISVFEIVVILIMFFGGIGLTFRGILHAKDDTDGTNGDNRKGK